MECPCSSNLAEQEDTCLPLPRDNPHRGQASVGSSMNTLTSSSACLDRRNKRAVEKKYPLHNGLLPVWGWMLHSLCTARNDKVLSQGEGTAASWQKALIPKGVQARTSHARGLSGEWQRDSSLEYNKG